MTIRSYGGIISREVRESCGKRGRGIMITSTIGNNGVRENGGHGKSYLHGKMNIK